MSERASGMAVLADHCVTAAGHGTALALLAVQAGIGATARHPALTTRSPAGENEPVQYAPALDDPVVPRRIALLDALLASLPSGGEGVDGSVPVCLLLSSNDPEDGGADHGRLREAAGALGHVHGLVDASPGGAALFDRVRDLMHGDGLDRLWLVAVDSLLATETLARLARTTTLQGESVDGLIPGEAAVAVLLANTDQAPPEAPRIAAWRDAPAAEGEGDAAPAVQAAIRECLAPRGHGPETVEWVNSDDVGDTAAALEWDGCARGLWPDAPEPRRREALELGLIDSAPPASQRPELLRHAPVLGAVGCASLPLQIALAARQRLWRRRWARYVAETTSGPALVLARTGGGHRHVLVME